MTKEKDTRNVFVIGFVAIGLMLVLDAVIQPGYGMKSFLKFIFFLFIPLLYDVWVKNDCVRQLFRIKSRKKLLLSIGAGMLIYGIILGAYFLLKSVIDLAAIQQLLLDNVAVHRDNFVLVAIYISFVNSLLEELFFRGFLFMRLRKQVTPKIATSISAFAFAVYHVAMLAGWFHPALFLLAMTGLFVGGLIFNQLAAWSDSIYTSWLAHMMANLAINTVGFIMFGII